MIYIYIFLDVTVGGKVSKTLQEKSLTSWKRKCYPGIRSKSPSTASRSVAQEKEEEANVQARASGES